MKNSIVFITLIGACLWFGCSKPKHVEPLDDNSFTGICQVIEMPPCDSVMCTMNVVAIALSVVDSSNTPVVLDSFYTTDMAGHKLPVGLYSYNNYSHNYIVLTDGWVQGHQRTNVHLLFQGYKNGVKIVDEPYSVNADCCHIQKVSGKDSVIIR